MKKDLNQKTRLLVESASCYECENRKEILEIELPFVRKAFYESNSTQEFIDTLNSQFTTIENGTNEKYSFMWENDYELVLRKVYNDKNFFLHVSQRPYSNSTY